MIHSLKDEIKLIESAINKLGDGLCILEAGCGRRWALDLAVTYRLVGIDPDERAIHARIASENDLQDYRVAAINDGDFPRHSFDVIYCSYVLEHVVGVRQVLQNFAEWTKPGGLIILRIPDSRSVYGFISRFTPHWVHVHVKRHVFRQTTSGLPGHGPYPVVYEREMSLRGIRAFCDDHGFQISASANGQYLERAPWTAPFAAALSILTLGYLKWRHCDLAVLIRT